MATPPRPPVPPESGIVFAAGADGALAAFARRPATSRWLQSLLALASGRRFFQPNTASAAGFAGADILGVEVFEPATTNALMAALWVHDLRHPGAAAHATTPLAHPLELFMGQACHGGLWRCPYLPRTVLPFAAALGWIRLRVRH